MGIWVLLGIGFLIATVGTAYLHYWQRTAQTHVVTEGLDKEIAEYTGKSPFMRALTRFLIILIVVLTAGVLYQGFSDPGSLPRALHPIKVIGTIIILGFCLFAGLMKSK
jgi:hypothetical protein